MLLSVVFGGRVLVYALVAEPLHALATLVAWVLLQQVLVRTVAAVAVLALVAATLAQEAAEASCTLALRILVALRMTVRTS